MASVARGSAPLGAPRPDERLRLAPVRGPRAIHRRPRALRGAPPHDLPGPPRLCLPGTPSGERVGRDGDRRPHAARARLPRIGGPHRGSSPERLGLRAAAHDRGQRGGAPSPRPDPPHPEAGNGSSSERGAVGRRGVLRPEPAARHRFAQRSRDRAGGGAPHHRRRRCCPRVAVEAGTTRCRQLQGAGAPGVARGGNTHRLFPVRHAGLHAAGASLEWRHVAQRLHRSGSLRRPPRRARRLRLSAQGLAARRAAHGLPPSPPLRAARRGYPLVGGGGDMAGSDPPLVRAPRRGGDAPRDSPRLSRDARIREPLPGRRPGPDRDHLGRLPGLALRPLRPRGGCLSHACPWAAACRTRSRAFCTT